MALADLKISDLPGATTPFDPTDLTVLVQDVGTISAQTNKATFAQMQTQVAKLTTKGDLLGHTGAAFVRIPVGANGKVPTADSSDANGWSWQEPNGDSLWNTSTSFLLPASTGTYKGIKLQNLALTATTQISYETNGIYYSSTDTSAIHRFWQTLQAETKIQLNNSGTLDATKGISLLSSSDDYKIGYDTASGFTSAMRANLLNAASTDAFVVSAGAIGSAPNVVSSINGLGQQILFTDQLNALAITGKTDTTKQLLLGYDVTNNKGFLQAQSGAGPTYRNLMLQPSGSNVCVGHPLSYSATNKLEVNGNISNNAYLISEWDATSAGQLKLGNAAQTGYLIAGLINSSGSGIIRAVTGDGASDIALLIQSSALSLKGLTSVIADAAGTDTANAQLRVKGSADANKQLRFMYDTSGDQSFILSTHDTVALTRLNFAGSDMLFTPGGTNILSIDSSGINVDRISQLTANGIRLAHKTSIGSTSTATAMLTGFGSTFLGVANSAFSSSTLAANQMQLSFDEATHTLTLQRKYNDGTTVKSYSLGPFT